MSQRRMFSLKVIDTDAFLDMPVTARLLYYDLNMRADDDGFVSSPKKIQRMVGCSNDDLKLLIAKQFVIPFDSGVCVIRHWRIHNYIQKDRYTPTMYKYEKSMLSNENGVYEVIPVDTKCIQNVPNMDTQVRLGKDRLEIEKKESIKKSEEAAAEAADFSFTPAEKPSDIGEDGGAQNVEANNKKAGSSGKGEEYTQEFEAFWSFYPRRHEKKAAFRCWNKRLKEKVKPDDIINATKNYKEYCTKCNTEEQFIKLPKTFLGRDKPYEEYIKGCPPLPTKPTPPTNSPNGMKKQLDAYKFHQRNYTEEELDSLFDDLDDV